MIDLRKMGRKPLQMTMTDGEVIELTSLKVCESKQVDDWYTSGGYDGLINAILMILNHNIKGKVFTKEYITEMDSDILNVIMTEYQKWVSGIEKN